jgi:hypothetical protein
VVIVQHEFGVYGGWDGADVLALLATLTVPTIVVLHTVLIAPTAHQREELEAVADPRVVGLCGRSSRRDVVGGTPFCMERATRQVTKAVLERALDEELTAHLGL